MTPATHAAWATYTTNNAAARHAYTLDRLQASGRCTQCGRAHTSTKRGRPTRRCWTCQKANQRHRRQDTAA